jgi:hypothetical protein
MPTMLTQFPPPDLTDDNPLPPHNSGIVTAGVYAPRDARRAAPRASVVSE